MLCASESPACWKISTRNWIQHWNLFFCVRYQIEFSFQFVCLVFSVLLAFIKYPVRLSPQFCMHNLFSPMLPALMLTIRGPSKLTVRCKVKSLSNTKCLQIYLFILYQKEQPGVFGSVSLDRLLSNKELQ